MTDFTARVVRDGKFWFITVDGVDGATQARTVREIEPMARDYISIMLGLPESEIMLATHIQLPAGAQAHLDRMAALRRESARAQTEAAEESRSAARELKASGLTTREVGSLMGVSHQRAHQLLSA
ncbi:hypothetical protein B7R22_14930 [Subtercola boreus]|uniref:HicB family toxin-antitoxin system n=1 Tax=Subtercola boreus TaxID=120213 RepID=A0A3E0VS32_9MICO|nr:hypothetical protein [Subtercola boreus]RFA12425.1 hypothetical protein B7R22_14930 [Subtercola boreus]